MSARLALTTQPEFQTLSLSHGLSHLSAIPKPLAGFSIPLQQFSDPVMAIGKFGRTRKLHDTRQAVVTAVDHALSNLTAVQHASDANQTRRRNLGFCGTFMFAALHDTEDEDDRLQERSGSMQIIVQIGPRTTLELAQTDAKRTAEKTMSVQEHFPPPAPLRPTKGSHTLAKLQQ